MPPKQRKRCRTTEKIDRPTPPKKRTRCRTTEKIDRPQSRSPSAMAQVTPIKSIEESLGSIEGRILQIKQLNDSFMESTRKSIASSQESGDDDTIKNLQIETEQRLAFFNDMVNKLTSGLPPNYTNLDDAADHKELQIPCSPRRPTSWEYFRDRPHPPNSVVKLARLGPKPMLDIPHDPSLGHLEISLVKGRINQKQQEQLVQSVRFVWDPLENITTWDHISSVNDVRYLCVSNGLTLLCLDLHQNQNSENDQKIKPLPIHDKLIFPTQGLPFSMAMFNLGSDAYMVGGHRFPALAEESNNPLNSFYTSETFECIPSLETYHLALVEGKLSLSPSDKPLKQPKIWPVVEKVAQQLHVFESYPRPWCPKIPNPTTPSHEVLGETEFTPQHLDDIWSFQYEIWHSLAVGSRVYSTRTRAQFEVFDSATRKWELYDYVEPLEIPHPHSVKHIAELLKGGFGKCVGEYMHADHGRLYVVIGVGGDEGSGCIATAYLVTRTGQVLCFQRLPSLFGPDRQLSIGVRGTLIGNEGGTYCAIVPCYPKEFHSSAVFVATFTVEDSLCACLKFPRSVFSAKEAEMVDYDRFPYEVVGENQLVNLVVKDTHVFESMDDAVGYFGPSRLNACFLQSSARSSK